MEMKMEELRKEYRLKKLEMEISSSSCSIEEIKSELKKEYPDIKFDDDLLELVGTLPYNPVERDKEVIREAVRRVCLNPAM
jgi:hypothetical protein